MVSNTNGNGEGRDRKGRFAVGNPGGPGNPDMNKSRKWKDAFAHAVSFQDIKDVAVVLVEKAKEGEPWAVTELLSRTCGKPATTIDAEGITKLIVEFEETAIV